MTITAATIGAVLLERKDVTPGSYAYGLLYRARAIFLIALLLYLVILAIVSIIDYSRGIMKYAQHGSLYYGPFHNLLVINSPIGRHL